MSEKKKVQILKEQLKRIMQRDTVSEELKRTIRKLGYSPDQRTW